jgi:FkbM family methyltransferase
VLNKIALLFTYIIVLVDEIFNKLTNRNLRYKLQDQLRKLSIVNINHNNINMKFFTPSDLTFWRAKTFDEKEPETLEWIDKFILKKNKKTIFWDIGANIGNYSIYAGKKYKKKIEIFAFEPSGLNLGILAKNIILNKLDDEINICQLGLTNKKKSFFKMHESSDEEGGALSNFGSNLDFDGKKFNFKNKYKIFGTSIDDLVNEKVLKKPDYIKIDVDGNEHLILEKGQTILKGNSVKGILIEINENYKKQFKKVNKILIKNNFKFKSKHLSPYAVNSKFDKSYNYIFTKK